MFQKPVVSQHGSPLLSLPLEIRTPILKYLVTSTEAIPVAHESDSEPQQIHVAILRVCQRLHQEGMALFIKYNVPRVSITLHHWRSGVWVMNWHNGRDGPVIDDIAYNEFLKDTIPRFSRLRFEFSESLDLAQNKDWIRRHSFERGLQMSSQWLRKCDLSEKEVSIVLDPKIIEILELGQTPGHRYWVFAFDTIRCRRLHLPGMSGTYATNLTRVIEGRLSAPDLRAAFEEMRVHLVKCRAAIGSHDQSASDYRLERDMRKAVETLDAIQFEAARRAAMNQCEVYFEELKKEHEELKTAMSRPLLID